MTDKEVKAYRDSIINFSLDELLAEKARLEESIGKMIYECDQVIKTAIINTRIKEKEAANKR